MIFDSESVNETAKELSLTPAEVERALKIHAAYARHSKRLSNRRRMERERFLREKALAAEKLAYPGRCFCIEDGLETKHDYKSDQVVRYVTRKQLSYLGAWSGEYYDDPVYRCSTCGKEWRITYAIA